MPVEGTGARAIEHGVGASGHRDCAFDRHFTVGTSELTFEDGDTWMAVSDQTLGLEHLVGATSMSNHPELGCSESLRALFRGGFYIKPHGWL